MFLVEKVSLDRIVLWTQYIDIILLTSSYNFILEDCLTIFNNLLNTYWTLFEKFSLTISMALYINTYLFYFKLLYGNIDYRSTLLLNISVLFIVIKN